MPLTSRLLSQFLRAFTFPFDTADGHHRLEDHSFGSEPPRYADVPREDPAHTGRDGHKPKDMRTVMHLLEELGWQMVRAKKHYVFKRMKNGVRQTTVISKTPSSQRATRNIMADLNRHEQALDEILLGGKVRQESGPALLGVSNDLGDGGGRQKKKNQKR
jgi:predicted RNA binding protein YcfA (HicA-like mRNA interferase family)